MKKIAALLIALAAPVHAEPEIGKPAPGFTLKDCGGTPRSLSDFRGKIVVLEWTNQGCPFVKKHYSSGNMQKLQKEAKEKGVVWLTVCSSAPGKPGHLTAAEAKKMCGQLGAAATAYLLDDEGTVGQIYGAKVTPEMVVINALGDLVYQGAIDDKKSTDTADIAGAKNHVVAAIEDTLAGKSVKIAKTDPYGCAIKYAK